MNLPNAVTLARVAVCPAIFILALSPATGLRYGAFVLFLLAAFSDVWDGHLARKHGLVTDAGKLLDPLADKLLLASTLVPFYLIGQRADALERMPWWGAFPLWALALVFGRELLVTLFRGYAVRRGMVIQAGPSGKHTALAQNLFIGGVLLWHPLVRTAAEADWSSGVWIAWRAVHSTWIGVLFAAALVLTAYSMLDYFWRYRAIWRRR